jgi:hypothetical protein
VGPSQRLVFRVHAVQQMFRRGVSEIEVRAVIEAGEVIERYPDDLPLPAVLILGWRDEGRSRTPLHVVVSSDAEAGTLYVVTVYVPDPRLWEPGFRRRKTA